MRTITVTEKHKAVNEGRMSKSEFVRQMRQSYPMYISPQNGYDATVQILKNKQMLFEEKEYEVDDTFKYSDDSLRRAIDIELEAMGLMSHGTISMEDQVKAKKKAIANLKKDPLHYYHLISGDSSKVNKHDKPVEVKKGNEVDTFNGMKKAELKEDVEKELGASNGEISDLVKNEKHIKDKLDKAGKKYSKSYDKDKHGQKIVVFKLKENLNEGTRALVGYLAGNRLTTAYNHYDGYPSGLGKGLMTHYNNDDLAKDIAMKGYITSMDPDSGEISQTHQDPPKKITLPEDSEEMAREVAEEIDGMGADYGYIWHDEMNQWHTIKNTGIRSMIDQITDKMGMQTEVEEDIVPAEEAVAEPTLKETLGGVVAFLKSKGAKNDSIKDFIKTHKDDIEGMSMADVEDEYNNFLSVNTDYVDEAKTIDVYGDGDVIVNIDKATPEQERLINFEFEISEFGDAAEAQEVADQIMNLNSADDVENYYANVRGWDDSDDMRPMVRSAVDIFRGLDEKKGKDHDGDGDIDSDDYMAAKDKAIKKAMGKEVNEDADDEHMVHELIGDLFAPGNARSHLDFSVEVIAKALEDYKEDLTRQGVKDAMDLYDKLAADGTLDKEVEDGNGFISSKHVPKLKKAFELIGLYGKGINESVVRKNLKSIITKVLEEEVINEAATNDLAKIADEYEDFGGLKPAVISLQNIVTEIESFYDKTREKIQKVYDALGNVTNDEGLKVGAFITPSIENAFKRDLKHIIKNQFTGGLNMPQVRRISQDDIDRGTVQQEAPKDTVFSPVNEKKNKNEK